MSKEAAEEAEKTDPEDRKKSMEKWMDWAKECGEGLVDLGSPLGNGQKISQDGNTQSDGDVVGYSILQAEDMDAAKKLLEGHPHLGWSTGCDIEVHECMPMPS